MRKSKIKLLTFILVTVLLMEVIFLTSRSFADSYDGNLKATGNVLSGSVIYPAKVINDFNSPEDVATWSQGENTKSINYVTSILNGPSSVYEGSGSLEQVPEQVKVYEWRTIYREFTTPLDLSNENYLALGVNSWGWQPVDYFLKIRLHSGSDIYEGTAKIHPDQWNTVFLNIKQWDNKNEITKIELSYMQNFDLEGVAPGAPGYDYWDGRFQIDYLTATNILDMGFSIDGDSEGFTTHNGTITVSNSALKFDITGEKPFIESASFIQDISKRNTLSVKMKNQTDAEKVKIAWITDEDHIWDEKKSKVFDIIPHSDFNMYDFNLSDNESWKGSLKQFRIYPIINNPTGTIEIDEIKFNILEDIKTDYVGNIGNSEINNEEKIEIVGKVKPEYLTKNPESNLLLFEMATYENEEEDLEQLTPLEIKEASENFSFEINLQQDNHNRLYSKFVVAAKNDAGELSLVDSAKYITNPGKVSNNNYPFPQARSKKGLQVYMTDDAEELGISHGAINVPYNLLLYKADNNPENTIPYTFEGETFYFKKHYIEFLDNQIKSLSDNNVIVSLILIMYRDLKSDSPNEQIIHPDSEPGGTVYAFNTTNEIGVKYYKAITNFISERYTRTDQKFGRAVNFIVGNEIGQNKVWNNMGPKLITDYVKDYARTLRLTNTIVKSNYQNGRVYISLDHFWDENLPPDSMWKYDNKAIVDILTSHLKQEGDIPWNMAFHPYPENLFDPRFWEDETAVEDFNTNRITFKNLHVLVDYMKQPNYLYNGNMRRIILSEQGFHSGDNSPEAQKVHAAAYAYAYYKVKFLEGIDSFILHRHVDHAQEGGLNLGLWTNKQGEVSIPDQQKYVYDVFKYIDTKKSLEVTEFAKPIIGINDWIEGIPNFDSSQLADRSLPVFVGSNFIKKSLAPVIVENFENGIGKWERADNANSIEQNMNDVYKGEGSLQVNFNSLSNLWKGANMKFNQPINAISTPYLNLALKLPDFETTNKYYAKVKVYSGLNYAESIVNLDPSHGWNGIALNLKSWEGIDSIDRIKVWVRSSANENWTGSLLIDEVGFSKRVVPVGGYTNLDIITTKNKKNLEVGTEVKVKVTNYDTSNLQGEITIEPSDYITFSEDALKMNQVKPGESETFLLTVTDYTPPVSGFVSANFTYRERKIENVLEIMEDTGEQDLPPSVGLLYNFEDNVQGWSTVENVASVKTSESFLNAPQTPYLGNYVLAARSNPVPATDWKTINVNPDVPIDLSNASEVFYYINSYGGVPNAAYESKVTLHSGEKSISKTVLINPDQWNEIRLDINDCVYKNNVTRIEISFRAVGNDMTWDPEFQIDFVGYEKINK
jgi:hypothetical protein